MIQLLSANTSALGVSLSNGYVTIVQASGDGKQIRDVARIERKGAGVEELAAQLKDLIATRQFKGRAVTVCLDDELLAIQNIRVPMNSTHLESTIKSELKDRLSYKVDDAELRHIEVGEIRQGETRCREFIVIACEKTKLDQWLDAFVEAGLRPTAVDIEPMALLRGYLSQYQRDEDQGSRAMCVRVGMKRTAVVIAEGEKVCLIKYIELGGAQLDAAVARQFHLDERAAHSLRKRQTDRRKGDVDPEVARSIAVASRQIIDKLAQELAMYARYYSITFRGAPITRVVVGGEEATESLCEAIESHLEINCVLSDPFRYMSGNVPTAPTTQWDVATGVALRPAFMKAAKS